MSDARPAMQRLLFVDNLRWTMIILVLSMHASDTYSPFGNWYYTEHPPVALGSALAFGFYQTFLQAFFMALLFFVSGYFAVSSLARKGGPAFMRERLVRLGIPTLCYMLVIGPLTQYFLSRTWGSGGFLYQWLHHIQDGQILSETGPMWFAAVLLLFSLIYAALPRDAQSSEAGVSTPSNRAIVIFILTMALATFVVRIALPENVSILNYHLGDFPQYILMFCGGLLAGRNGWLTYYPAPLAFRWAAILVGLSLVLFPLLIAFGGALENRTADYSGGLNPTSFVKCLWEAMVCIGMSMGLLALFRANFNTQGRVAKVLSDNAFAVYVIHPPVLISLAIALHGVSAPALAKAALLTLVAAIATFSLSWLVVRRVPLLSRVL